MARISFTPLALKNLKPPPARRPGVVTQVDYFDESTPGFGLRISSTGIRSWFVMDRVDGRTRRITLGRAPREPGAHGLGLADARQRATALRRDIANGVQIPAAAPLPTPAPVPAITFETLAADFIEKHAKPNTKRWKETQQIFARLVTPGWGAKPVSTITRRDVNALLARVATENGPIMANRTLAAISKMFGWWQIQDDDFTTPIVKGMAPAAPKERERVLSDPEIRAVWEGVANEALYGPILKVLLLTMSRREEVAQMRREELEPDYSGGPLWTIPGERTKNGKPKVVPLPPAAWALISAQPIWEGCPYVFSPDGKRPFTNFGRAKELLNAKLGVMPGWTVHDLRRTGRTIMASLKIDDRVGEMCLGHTIKGVEGIYNRYAYLDEKRDAFQKLSDRIAQIVA